MKKYIIGSALAMAALFSACGNKEKTNEAAQPAATDTVQKTPVVQLEEVFTDSTFQLTGVAVSP